MISSPLFMLFIGLLVSAAWMLLTYAISLRIRNSGVVDVAWSSGFLILTAIYSAACYPMPLRSWLFCAMVSLWSIRLTAHLLQRFLRWYPNEDPRYVQLKEDLGAKSDQLMPAIFLWQGAVMVALSAPVSVAFSDHSAGLTAAQYLAIALWTVGIVGESIADTQLEGFSKDPANKGRTCQIGMWRYSRHPNYFFEWVISVSFFVYASTSPFGWVTVLAPLLLLHLLLNVTGVKPTEEHSLKTRKDYAEYQLSTSAFVPWFRRKAT